MIAGFRSLGGTSKTCPHPAKTEDGSGWNLALPRIRLGRMKLVKLANFKPAKRPIKMELGQLGQLFSMVALIDSFQFWWASKTRPHPTKTDDGSGWNLALPRIRLGPMKLVKLANFKPAKRAYKNGTWPTWPTFFDGCVDRFVSVLVGLEDSTAHYRFSKFRFGLSIVAQMP